MDKRIPTLDGWRGVAVLIVLAVHYQEYFFHRFLIYRTAWFGEHGVTIFFVVSGYLITSQLLREMNLKRFYVRRFFRLMPAAWVYLGTVALLSTTHRVVIGKDALGALFFFRNYLETTKGFTGHFWSLSMEEQCYLTWPLLLFVAGRRAGFWFALVGSLGVAAYRALFTDFMKPGFVPIFTTQVRIDAILVGCLLAYAMDRWREWITRHSRVMFWCCAPILAFDVWRYQAVPPLHENAAIALMVAATSVNPGLIGSRILEFPHLKQTGMFCYGIYLWQGLFFRAAFGAIGVLLLPIAVMLSWKLIEEPCQRLGKRLSATVRESEFRQSTRTLVLQQ